MGHKYKDLVLQVGGLGARPTNFLCKTVTAVKSKEVETSCNLIKSSKEGCGSKRAALPLMVMNRMINECEAVGGMIIGGRKRITRRKPVPAPLIHSDEGTYWKKVGRKAKKLKGRGH
jgi:hypothetical protein